MSGKHIAILATCLGTLGGMIAALPEWQFALAPAFIGSALVNVCTVIAGIYTDSPEAKE